jgi:type IV pilus assembly protein PilF
VGEIERNPENDAAALRAVYESAQAGRFVQAAALANAALARGLEHPLLYNVAALEREQQGRVLEALGLLQRAVQIAPNDVGSRNALGLCLLRLERPADALTHFQALLALDPTLPYVYVSHGNALWELGELSAAEANFKRALELDANQGIALTRLAQIAANRGAYPEARAFAEKALVLAPGFPDAVLALAAAELGERQLPQAEERVRALLADTRLVAIDRAYTQGLLGRCLGCT